MVGLLSEVKHASGRVLVQAVNSVVKAHRKYCLMQRTVML